MIKWAYDYELISTNKKSHPSRRNVDRDTIGGPGLEWGAYLQFETPSERLSNVYLPFLVDMFMNSVHLLPDEEKVNKERR